MKEKTQLKLVCSRTWRGSNSWRIWFGVDKSLLKVWNAESPSHQSRRGKEGSSFPEEFHLLIAGVLLSLGWSWHQRDSEVTTEPRCHPQLWGQPALSQVPKSRHQQHCCTWCWTRVLGGFMGFLLKACSSRDKGWGAGPYLTPWAVGQPELGLRQEPVMPKAKGQKGPRRCPSQWQAWQCLGSITAIKPFVGLLSVPEVKKKGLCISPGWFWGLKCDFLGTQAHSGLLQGMVFSHIRIFKIDFIQLWRLHQLFPLLKQTVPWNSSGDTHWNACKLCTCICSLPAMAEVSIKKAFPSLLQHLSAASKCQYYPQWEEVGGGKVGSIRELIATQNWELGTLHALCCRDPALSGLSAQPPIYRATLCAAMTITGNEFMVMRRYSSTLKERSLQFINNRSLWNKTQKNACAKPTSPDHSLFSPRTWPMRCKSSALKDKLKGIFLLRCHK